MERRLRRRPERELARDVWAATYLLLGLRYDLDFARILLQGVLRMRESVTYQAVVEEGELKEARKMLLLIGKKLLGTPDPSTRAAVNSLEDLAHLEGLAKRAFDVHSWQELLGQPAPRRRNGRRKNHP
jgi:hypothetical protein